MSANNAHTNNSTALTTAGWVTERGGGGGGGGQVVGNPWDSSDPYISAHTRDLMLSVLKCYLQQIISVIGILGNALCCVVFWKQGLSDRINLLLFWLAAIDLVNLAVQLPAFLTCYTSDWVLINNVTILINAKMGRIYMACGIVSGCLIVVMSVERCLFVVIPFKARRLLTYRSMVTAILLSYIIPFLAYLPTFLADTVRWQPDPSTNRSVAYMVPTSWFPAGNFKTLFASYLNLIGQPLCFIAVVGCSIVTIIHLRQTTVKRLEMTGKSSEEKSSSDNRLTVMLLFLCFVYAIVCLCQVCGSIIHEAVPEFFVYKTYHNSFILYFQGLLLTASSLNSTINFCTYLVLSSRFRATLQEMCPHFCRAVNKVSQPAAVNS
ncbi:hypothetical protein ACOMHN_020784 [Nucella lapillus]